MSDCGTDLISLFERFPNGLAAAEYLETLRWPNGPVCPHCGESERKPYRLKSKTRRLWKCAACRKQYTVTVGSIFESSHIPLHKWVIAFHLLCASKKGMSSHQLHRMLGITYKSAWFMTHRIRLAMEQSPFQERLRGVVEADETYIGGDEQKRKKADKRGKQGRGTDKAPVLALVQRGGTVRSFHVADVTGATLKGAIRRNVAVSARIMTDQWRGYGRLGEEFADHQVVNHSHGEYVRGEAHTNTAENYFSILQRGIDGVYHHVSKAHLGRYLAEFDFRYNNRIALGVDDAERTRRALSMTGGKRLMYSDSR